MLGDLGSVSSSGKTLSSQRVNDAVSSMRNG